MLPESLPGTLSSTVFYRRGCLKFFARSRARIYRSAARRVAYARLHTQLLPLEGGKINK